VRRGAVIVVAVAVLVWLAVMERDVRLQASGVAAAERRDVAAADADFRAARLLSPDTLPDVRRAFLYRSDGRTDEAADVLEDVLRREPDNLDAWGLLYVFTQDERALEARRRLDPLGADR
jgi:predicted Zn-dependent protease